jgi:hypothetical protein
VNSSLQDEALVAIRFFSLPFLFVAVAPKILFSLSEIKNTADKV